MSCSSKENKCSLRDLLVQSYNSDKYKYIDPPILGESRSDIPICDVSLSLTLRGKGSLSDDIWMESNRDRQKQIKKWEKHNQNFVTIKDVFESHELRSRIDNPKEIKHVLIHGQPGMGKSTMCQFIACKWADNSLWGDIFEYVFWIRLRDLETVTSELQESTDIEQTANIIYALCLDHDNSSSSLDKYGILDQIKVALNSRAKALFLLDGYDEIPQDIKSPIYELSHNLISQSRKHYRIITSRPYRLTNLNRSDIELENVGFSADQIEKYIELYFQGSVQKMGKSLMAYLKDSTDLYNLAHVPLNLALMCGLYEDFIPPRIFSSDMSMTDLYCLITSQLVDRYLKTRKIRPSNSGYQCRIEINSLCFLAFNSIKNTNTMVLQPSLYMSKPMKIMEEEYTLETKEEDLLLTLCRLGILKNVSRNAKDLKYGSLEFCHFTFQEFFAARYICNYLESTELEYRHLAKDFIISEKHNPYYRVVFQFISGLIKIRLNMTQQSVFWDLLWDYPRDLMGLDYICLIITCLRQVHYDHETPRIHYNLEIISEWSKKYLTEHTVLLCKDLFRVISGNHGVIKAVVRKMVSLLISIDDSNTFSQIREALKQIGRFPSNVEPILESVDLVLGQGYNMMAEHVLKDFDNLDCNPELKVRVLCSMIKDHCSPIAIVDTWPNISSPIKRRLITMIGHMERILSSEDFGPNQSYVIDDISQANITEKIDNIIRRLEYCYSHKRSRAIDALGQISTTNVHNVLLRLFSILEDPNESRRCKSVATVALEATATYCLNIYDIMMKNLVPRISGSSIVNRVAGVIAVGKCGKHLPDTNFFVDLLIPLLDTKEDHQVRSAAINAIVDMQHGYTKREALTRHVLSFTTDIDVDLRNGAYQIVREADRFGSMADEVATRAVFALGFDNPSIRRLGCDILSNLAVSYSKVDELIDIVIRCKNDRDANVRRSVVMILSGLFCRSHRAENILICMLKDRDVASSVATVLVEKGKILTVAKNLRLEDHRIGSMLETVNGISRDYPIVAGANMEIRLSCARALAHIKKKLPKLSRVINCLIYALRDHSFMVVYSAAYSLGQLSKIMLDVNRIVDSLIQALFVLRCHHHRIYGPNKDIQSDGHDINHYQYYTFEIQNFTRHVATLGMIGYVMLGILDALYNVGNAILSCEDPTLVIDLFVWLLDHGDSRLKDSAAKVLGEMDFRGHSSAASRVIGVILSILNKEKDGLSQYTAITTLGKIGVNASDVNRIVDALIPFLEEKNLQGDSAPIQAFISIGCITLHIDLIVNSIIEKVLTSEVLYPYNYASVLGSIKLRDAHFRKLLGSEKLISSLLIPVSWWKGPIIINRELNSFHLSQGDTNINITVSDPMSLASSILHFTDIEDVKVPFSILDCKIAIVTALYIERAAIEALFDESYSELKNERRSGHDKYSYVYGKLGNHSVISASLSYGTYSNLPMHDLVTRLLDSHPEVTDVLVVGIAGGIPHLTQKGLSHRDIRLGDVVISSSPTFKYDYIKYIKGKIEYVSHESKPSSSLRNLSTAIQSEMERDNSVLLQLKATSNSLHTKMLEEKQEFYKRPHESNDRLFSKDFKHEDPDTECESICLGDVNNLVERKKRADPSRPQIWMGTIASADQVLKDPYKRDILRDYKAHGAVLAVEMESAGASAAVEGRACYYTIRGICDYCDTHKNDRWQGYAACVAASMTKILLGRLPNA